MMSFFNVYIFNKSSTLHFDIFSFCRCKFFFRKKRKKKKKKKKKKESKLVELLTSNSQKEKSALSQRQFFLKSV